MSSNLSFKCFGVRTTRKQYALCANMKNDVYYLQLRHVPGAVWKDKKKKIFCDPNNQSVKEEQLY